MLGRQSRTRRQRELATMLSRKDRVASIKYVPEGVTLYISPTPRRAYCPARSRTSVACLCTYKSRYTLRQAVKKKPQSPSSSHPEKKGWSVWADIECRTVVSSVARRVGNRTRQKKQQATSHKRARLNATHQISVLSAAPRHRGCQVFRD